MGSSRLSSRDNGITLLQRSVQLSGGMLSLKPGFQCHEDGSLLADLDHHGNFRRLYWEFQIKLDYDHHLVYMIYRFSTEEILWAVPWSSNPQTPFITAMSYCWYFLSLTWVLQFVEPNHIKKLWLCWVYSITLWRAFKERKIDPNKMRVTQNMCILLSHTLLPGLLKVGMAVGLIVWEVLDPFPASVCCTVVILTIWFAWSLHFCSCIHIKMGAFIYN